MELISINSWPFTYDMFVPEGYNLVENTEHKTQRLQKSIDEKKASVSFLTKRITDLGAEIEDEEKELLSLNP